MKSRALFSVRSAIYLTLAILAAVLLALRFNPQQKFVPTDLIRMLTTLLIVALILKAGEPAVHIFKSILPSSSRLGFSARVGLGLFLLGTLILVISIPAVLLWDLCWLFIPPATIIYCIGLFFLQREHTDLGPAHYSRSAMGISLLHSLFGCMLLYDLVPNTKPGWLGTLLVIYLVLIVPIAGAMVIVREEPGRRAG